WEWCPGVVGSGSGGAAAHEERGHHPGPHPAAEAVCAPTCPVTAPATAGPASCGVAERCRRESYTAGVVSLCDVSWIAAQSHAAGDHYRVLRVASGGLELHI